VGFVRNFSDKTRDDYIHHIKCFASFLGPSPDRSYVERPLTFVCEPRKS